MKYHFYPSSLFLASLIFKLLIIAMQFYVILFTIANYIYARLYRFCVVSLSTRDYCITYR